MRHPIKSHVLRSLIAAITLVVAAGAGAFLTARPAAATITATAPGTPSGLSATTGDGTVTLSWTAPNDGGSPILSYTVIQSYNGITSVVGVTANTTLDITDLTNGGSYAYAVWATNAIGSGTQSAPYLATPSTKPDAPSLVSLVPGNNSIAFNWAASSDGGSAITGYTLYVLDQTSSAEISQNVGGDLSSFTMTGLTNGDSYMGYLTATNAKGTSGASNTSLATPAPTAPLAPTGLAATPGDRQVALSWNAPDDGGSPVTGYWVKYSTGGNPAYTVAAGNNTSTTITGLTNGESYQFQVEAGNRHGTGPLSSVTSATPAGVPDAPTNVIASAGPASATFSYTAPADNGAAITGYVGRYTTDSGSTWSDPRTLVDEVAFEGLTGGTSYQFEIAAVNSTGQGPWSDMTSPPTLIPTAPGAPTDVAVTPGNQSVVVGWNPPASDGGSAITSYTAYAYLNTGATPRGGATPFLGPRPAGQCSTDGSGRSCTITGLSTGLQYRFVVIAANDFESSLDSAPVISGPFALPGYPTNVVAATGKAGQSQLDVSWTAPTTNAGLAPVTNYQVSYRVHGSTGSWSTFSTDGTSTSLVLSGLSQLTSYDVFVQANSAVGYGDNSDTATGASSAGPPTVPGNVKVTPGDSSLLVSWTASESQAPGHVTYTAEAFTGSQLAKLRGAGVRGSAGHPAGKCVTQSTSCTIKGLVNGTKYKVLVIASNGGMAGSAFVTGTPVATPVVTPPSTTPVSSAPVANNKIAAGGAHPSRGGEGGLLAVVGALLLGTAGAATWRRRVSQD